MARAWAGAGRRRRADSLGHQPIEKRRLAHRRAQYAPCPLASSRRLTLAWRSLAPKIRGNELIGCAYKSASAADHFRAGDQSEGGKGIGAPDSATGCCVQTR